MTSAILKKIADADDVTSEPVEIPEWGVTIDVRDVTLEERDLLAALMVAERDETDGAKKATTFHTALCQATCFDPDTGERVFVTDDDVAILRVKSAKAVTRLTDVAYRLLGFGAEAVEEGKDDSSSIPNGGTASS